MKINTLCLTFLLWTLAACAQTTSHNDAISYYVKVTNNTKDAYLSMSNAALVLTNYTAIASESKDFILEPTRVDTLKRSFESLTSTLKSNIGKLDSLIEIDPEIAFKDSVKVIYKDAIQAFGNILPKFVDIFQYGYKATSKEEIGTNWNAFQNSLKSISKKLELLGQQSSKFLGKYNITETELKQNGL